MPTDRPPSAAAPDAAPAVPRVLCVLDRHPLPADTAARRRLWNVLRGIAGVATGTVVVLGGDTEPDRVDALAAALVSWEVVALPRDVRRAPVVRPRRVIGRARLPRHLARRDPSGWRAALADELARGYDLVYTSHPRPFVLVEELTELPVVASVDDALAERAADAPDADPARGRARDGDGDGATGAGAGVGARLHQRICRRAAVVLVPTPEDRDALPGGRVMVMPDGADIPALPPPRDAPGPPTVVLFGRLTDPTAAAGEAFVLEHLVDEVRRRVPGARVRVVGRVGDDVRALAALHPGVVLGGHAEDPAAELGAADAAAIPAHRIGAARHRILEAFAHGRPVVTTSIGIHGLDVTPGRQVLVADDIASTAAAITAVLRDHHLAAALGDEGRRLVCQRYDWALVRHLVGEVVVGAAARRPGTGEPVDVGSPTRATTRH